ncbi:MAG: hypothetical protein IJK22_11355 [Bacteroidales bacterium]|nr:hypothetical protein [Bacteroidales bacterium]
MSNKEIKEFEKKLIYGLTLAEKRMLQEKALREEFVIMQSSDGEIRRVPAKQVIAENVIFQ